MRILIGIDETPRHNVTLDLVARLRFENLQLSLVNVLPVTDSFVWMYSGQVVLNYEEVVGNLRERGNRLLEDAVDDACSRNLRADTILMTGGKAEGLATAADNCKADLVAVACDPKTPLDRLMSGSVAQTLSLNAHQSILICRNHRNKNGSVRAVFATDHSGYANRCLDRLLSWHPQGLEHVQVVTAWSVIGHESATAGNEILVGREEVNSFVAAQVSAKTDAVAQRFRDSGIPADALTLQGQPNKVINEAMHDTRSDLLIIGARGHGSWDRPVLGATAMHQVCSETHSVLVLRSLGRPA